MFILIICTPLLFLSLVWHRFNTSSHSILRGVFWLSFTTYFTSFYMNGVDWSIYYLKFLGDDNPYLSFEVGFVLFFKTLLFLTLGNFGAAILIFYFIAFGFLISVLKNKVNEPLFYTCLFLIFGYTLILEQLRQFIACIIVLFAVLKYQKGSSLKIVFSWIVVASFFHISALIFIPTLLLVAIRSVTLFTFSIIFTVLAFVMVIFVGYTIIDILAQYSFAFKKISFYLQQAPLQLTFGWLNILDFIYILFYCVYRRVIDRNSDMAFFARVIFVGTTIHMFSGAVTFLARVGFFYYFIAIYLFALSPYLRGKRLLAIKSYTTLMISIFFSIVLFFNFSSYFRNAASPVEFENLNFYFLNTFDDDFSKALAMEKYLDAMKNSSEENE